MLRTIFLLSLLIAAWLWMQIVHECGHVLGALLTNGIVQHVELHPLTISRTDVQGSTQPLVVIWAGPVVGGVLPLLVWWIAIAARSQAAFLFRFFAGFCLLANGVYLAAGSFDGVGDCGDLLRHGAPIWSLWLFGFITIPPGLWLWHEQGQNFRFRAEGKTISAAISYGTIAFAVVTIVGEVIYSGL
jgi:hypothetical protein